jgi:hydrogenase expression/formation protein HypE
MTTTPLLTGTCPAPAAEADLVLLAHGGGGRLTRRLIDRLIVPAFDNELLRLLHDGAVAPSPDGQLAFTTDSFVVRPLEFPGGDIGTLAVNGTLNDLACCGAAPLYLSCALILEEGLPMATLERTLASMRRAASEAGVPIVTGDTKVVDRGKGDGIYINTAGIGRVRPGLTVSPLQIREGDVILLSGDIGRHGMAVMAVREGLQFESPLVSDCAPLHRLVADLLAGGVEIHCLRDLTRGGLAAALVEIAESAALRFDVDEAALPVEATVRGACEILGLDPLHVACEGRLVAFVPESQAESALAIMRRHECARQASRLGRVSVSVPGRVVMRTPLGTDRILDLPLGEPLPRIC